MHALGHDSACNGRKQGSSSFWENCGSKLCPDRDRGAPHSQNWRPILSGFWILEDNRLTKTMRACSLHKVKGLEVRELARPELKPHEVLVRVSAVGLCGTDFHIYSG